MSGMHSMAGPRRDGISPPFLLVSRSLLSLFAFLLLATPWTEGYRLLDNFPRGQDSEVSLLAILVFLGIVLLLSRSARLRMCSLLLLSRLWQFALRGTRPFQRFVHDYAFAQAIPPPMSSLPKAFDIPLQL